MQIKLKVSLVSVIFRVDHHTKLMNSELEKLMDAVKELMSELDDNKEKRELEMVYLRFQVILDQNAKENLAKLQKYALSDNDSGLLREVLLLSSIDSRCSRQFFYSFRRKCLVNRLGKTVEGIEFRDNGRSVVGLRVENLGLRKKLIIGRWDQPLLFVTDVSSQGLKAIEAVANAISLVEASLEPGTELNEDNQPEAAKKWWKSRANVNKQLQQSLISLEKHLLRGSEILLLPLDRNPETSFVEKLEHFKQDKLMPLVEELEITNVSSLNRRYFSNCVLLFVRQKDQWKTLKFSKAGAKSILRTFIDETKQNEDTLSQIVDEMFQEFSTKGRRLRRNLTSAFKDLTLSTEADDNTLLLCLAEDLLFIPWENLSCFEDVAVSRIWNFDDIISAEADGLRSNIVSGEVGLALVDPEGNLPKTAHCLKPLLKKLKSSFDWNICFQKVPKVKQMLKLISKNNIYLYSGHGSGQKYLPREQILSYFLPSSEGNKDEQMKKNLGAVFLIGCSSGKIKVSHDRKMFSESVVWAWLEAGAKCVVCCQFDVTDQDIDRFTIALLSHLLQDGEEKQELSVQECVRRARKECKLRFAVGAAPVCYGLPVFVKTKE